MELFLSPSGRIDQPTYWRAVLILAGISTALWVLTAYVNPIIFMLGFLFWWPWIAVHAKRLHDANQTGWITVGLIVGAFVLYFVLAGLFAGLIGDPQKTAALQAELESAQSSQDLGAMMETLSLMMQDQLLPTLLTLFAMTGIIGAVMGLFKTDPNDNEYGPGPGGSASADLFE